MANGQNTEIVKALLPKLIEAISNWWRRRQERKKAGQAEKVESSVERD